jgi:high-affinity nickel-transport protein
MEVKGALKPVHAAAGSFGFASIGSGLQMRLVRLYAVIGALNAGSWGWALVAFQAQPSLIGVALLVYGLGLRHAVDADHIAAIDNVTRKLMQDGQFPTSVGFFFALGHSFIVILVAVAVARMVVSVGDIRGLQAAGGVISTSVSTLFLFGIAAMNIVTFQSVVAQYRASRGATDSVPCVDAPLRGAGIVSRLCRPLFRLVAHEWQMLLIGFLFGLGFDTATEVAMFAVSATQAASAVPLHALLVLPVLFAAGMTLVDTTDGVMMLGAYGWAMADPGRKLRYNMAITLISAAAAIGIGSIEAAGLWPGATVAAGGLRQAIAALNCHFNQLGIAMIILFSLAWAISRFAYHTTR